VLERAEALQANGDAFEDQCDVGGAEGAGDVSEVRGLGTLAERSGEAFGPEDEEPDDDEAQEVGERQPVSLCPGGGGCCGGRGD
jgi:hypothetical protein